MFQKILIANRGEIACRVIKTAKKMGIKTVAVYSDADRDARHVELADEAVHIGPAPSRESYLAMDKIIDACKQTGAQAVHPGYGFLSENEAFARKVEEQGIVFIGPKHASIAAMGDKIASKKLAKEARVNTIPGHNAAIDTPQQAVEIAKGIGYPVMIKASAGGGGKGLRVAFNDKEAFEGFSSCRNEARNSFGDDRVFIEKFVEEPRHIEIQVLGDAYGNTVYLWERECSIQRRHQKVIEEAPSPFLDEATRKAMGEQAVALAKAVNYQSAGTVEFVVGKDRSFYFLEMNTRLQVEHPVTECITGLDLVELMIRVAAGEKLPFTQSQIRREGWAMECRINAEDPFRSFLPATGRLVKYAPPDESGGVRVDTGVYEGGEIPMFYDSMIAKLIVHGRDRAEAIAKMRQALNAFAIRGIHSNIPFQAALLAHPKFMAGDFNTGFIAEQYPKGFSAASVPHEDPTFLRVLAAVANRVHTQRAMRLSGQLPGHEYRVGEDFVVVTPAGEGRSEQTPVKLSVHDRAFDVSAGGRRYLIEIHTPLRKLVVRGSCNGAPFCAQIERLGLAYRVMHDGAQIDAKVFTPRAAELDATMPFKAPPDLSRFLLSPMPGLLVDVAVQAGQSVRAGEKLAVIEAMKMENILLAAQDCVVEEVVANKGESLAVDQVIIRFK
ncbi:MAG TPA: acetyl-CoA carboxylase biotin carboxylase subunit [Albitalea sp.]|uniref:acetyl-CoA carboxylase biotin carboxylase subunit n=1 Tax=Piscinibacter sp. TaxID=1903157 RepID=UPI002ED0A16A